MRAALVMLAMLGGCATAQTRTSMVNAPGNIELDKPPVRERGQPDAFEPPSDPGTSTLAVIPTASVLFGTGRGNPGTMVVDVNAEVRFERHLDKGRAPFGKTALGFTAGLAGMHIEDRVDFGALYGEVNFRFPTIARIVPTDIGVGPVVYPSNFEAGAQITVRLPLLALRFRYVERGGFEFWGGYSIPIPFLFQRSR